MKEHAILKTWMRDVQKSQNAVDSILLLPSTPLSFSRCSPAFFSILYAYNSLIVGLLRGCEL